ncbi:arsenate-mycothiol transferase ArsC [Frigoriflavimonas asaccharolytica]|uniref:Arsenate reductase n=1 Tax=Frigoriflavimonas asaccharolytica TaxID=2735899 RepID=A0A8J8K9D0_9FLAO|nr:protein-tyrosine-phosphatase [Frigoriflavimonas asaccharolytica]NRS93693.1 arsenate reductase [Frigoriflavimonas asaccharolytica]
MNFNINGFPEISSVIQSLNVELISTERKLILQDLVDFIQLKQDDEEQIRLNFICTHNSRRSHLAQVWAQTMAYYFKLNNVTCYSGGTEETALFPTIVERLRNSGFKIEKLSNQNNPVYSIKFGQNEHPIIGFSKKFNDDFNPKTAFAAILTCNSADEACPNVAGAEKRIAITYEDPKLFDGTSQQTEKYEERSLQIATEMKYVFSKIKF